MRLNRTDVIATVAVGLAVVVYLLWLAGVELPGLGSPRAVAATILGLGFVASAYAVVPGFDGLLGGSRSYLVVASALGVVALVAGLLALINASEPMLAALAAATVVLWALATVRHTRAAHRPPEATAATVPDHEPVGAGR